MVEAEDSIFWIRLAEGKDHGANAEGGKEE